MDIEKCNVDLRDDEKYGWRLIVSGDCSKILEDINLKLGEYGRRYLEERIVKGPVIQDEVTLTEEPIEKS